MLRLASSRITAFFSRVLPISFNMFGLTITLSRLQSFRSPSRRRIQLYKAQMAVCCSPGSTSRTLITFIFDLQLFYSQ
jgi:hypothetical protein